MITRRHFIAAAALVALSAPVAFSADLPVLRLATQVSGTVNWELTTIRDNGLDKANGFALDVRDVDGSPAAQIAFQAGEADAIVSDWLWVARQRAEGKDYVFIPYSRATGALMVPKDSPAKTVADLKGQSIGIAGGPVDKSWLIMRAYAKKAAGMDLAAETTQVFGAPPLIFQKAISGELGATINFWHFGAKMQAKGMRPLVTVSDAARDLGLDPQTPLLGYVVHESLLKDHPEVATGLIRASRAAKDLLGKDEAWTAIRPMMNAKSDAEFEALKAGFREGIPANGPVDEAAASKMLALMAELGGEELVGKATTLPAGVFFNPGS